MYERARSPPACNCRVDAGLVMKSARTARHLARYTATSFEALHLRSGRLSVRLEQHAPEAGRGKRRLDLRDGPGIAGIVRHQRRSLPDR